MPVRTSDERSLELRFILIYFWTYWLQNINTTYLNLFLRTQAGLTGTQIGVLASVLSLTGVLLIPLIAMRFDASTRRPAFLAVLALIAGGGFCLYWLPVPWWALIPCAVVFGCGWLPVVPLTDSIAATERVSGASRHGYGGYRRWGTLGFAAAGWLTGYLTPGQTLWPAFPVYAGCAAVVAWGLAGIPAGVASHPSGAGAARPLPGAEDAVSLLRQPNFRRFLAVVLFASIGSSGCYAFRSIYLASIGLSAAAIGRMWLLIIPGELICFTYAKRWLARWGTGPLVSAGLALSGLRWIILAFVRPPWLYLVEALHGVGFAVYFPAAVAFVQREAPARLRGTAQVLFFSTAAGIGNAIGSALAGRLYDLAGVATVLWTGGTLILAGGLLQILLVDHAPAARTGA